MSVQTYHLHPVTHYCTDTLSNGSGTHTAPGVWTEATGDCAGACDDLYGALDETDHAFLRSSSSAAAYNAGRFEYDFSPPPAGITISKVRVVAYLRTSNGGAAAIDESPRVKGFVNPAGSRYYQTGPTYVTVTNALNRQTQAPEGSYVRYVCGEWSTNPATATGWTLADLAAGTFKAGVEAGGVAEGQAGNGVPPTTGGSSASLDLAFMDVEVDGSPADLVIDPLRQLLSRHLRLRRRPRRAPVTLPATGRLLNAKAGETIYLDDPRWPVGSGAGVTPIDWDARPIFVQRRTESPLLHQGEIEGEDLREVYADFWSPLHTDLVADDQWTGVAWVDRGGGKAVVRAQGGWIWRPNDFLLRDAPSGKWRITPWGLLTCAGSYSGYTPNTGETTWHTLNNTFSQGTGGEGTSLATADTTGFTSWTTSKAGTGTVVIKADSSFLLDVTGYRRCVRLTQGAPLASNYARIYQDHAGFATTQRVRVCLKFKVIAGAYGTVAWRLARTTGANEWDQSAQTWGAAKWNKVTDGNGAGLASLRLVGDHYEFWSSDITVGGTGSQTLRLTLGFDGDSGSVEFQAAAVISTASTIGGTVFRREFIATQGSATIQARDDVTLDNQSTFRVLYATRGTFTAMATPLWDHEDLADGSRVAVYTATHMTGPTYFDNDTLVYHRTNATTGEWEFTRSRFAGNATAVFSCSSAAGTLPRYLTPVKLTARWTSASGELGLTAQTISVFRNGVKGTDAVAVDIARQVGVGPTLRLGIFEGFLAHVEVLPFCLTDVEIARRHAQLSLPALPAAA